MGIFYSALAHGFFDDSLCAALPDDAVAISPDQHADLLAAQGDGGRIEADADGMPCIRRDTQTLAMRRATFIARTKREAARRIEAVAPLWRQMNDIRAGDAGTATDAEGQAASARFALIDAIRAASNAIEAQIAGATAKDLKAIDLANHPLWPVE
ncbi:MerR family transcriptional regulator [Sphingobium yanoikuyae]|uniref:Tail fiber assembly protein n=1 Tax=Sphingobium yanoikuyae TaxID=13690 RepID=A0A291N2V2_SPHYA|nr:hypothetical protein [Sphingobium yanoikuyae]ATI81458.1 hypothetical protein A6768_16645 [Sphingobium yanoikuyae]